MQPAVGDPALAGELDWMTHRGPFQPLPLCDSLSVLFVSAGQEENKVSVSHYRVLTPLSFGREIRSSKAVVFLNDEPIIFVLF